MIQIVRRLHQNLVVVVWIDYDGRTDGLTKVPARVVSVGGKYVYVWRHANAIWWEEKWGWDLIGGRDQGVLASGRPWFSDDANRRLGLAGRMTVDKMVEVALAELAAGTMAAFATTIVERAE